MINYTDSDDALTFTIRVVPRASNSKIVGEINGALKIRIAAPPVDGAANAEVIKLLAKAFGVGKSSIEILSGHASKIKQVRIKQAKAGKLVQMSGTSENM